MKKTVILLACAVMCGSAAAQSLGEKTGVNTALGIAPKTEDFVREAAISDMFEIKSSQLAQTKAQGNIKSFADQMVTDHTKTSTDLKALAAQEHIAVPTALDDKHQKMLDKLSSETDAAFAKQYADDQVAGHKDAVSLLSRYSKNGPDDKLKTWAAATLPTLVHHLDMAQKLSE
jgi:putative membrane protein